MQAADRSRETRDTAATGAGCSELGAPVVAMTLIAAWRSPLFVAPFARRPPLRPEVSVPH
jgi:hypothetical protein